ncbi:MAG: hypothetical protein K2J29_06265 [Muribaculaceae bacterium]|nr:hypothetical protein [Muribaculaceae bacterium]
MGIRDKFGLPVNSSELSPEAMEDIKALIITVYKQSIANLEGGVAKLRIEVADLKQQLQEKSRLIDVMEPYVRNGLIKEIECLQDNNEAIRKESAYRKFFSGNMGFLYLFADILSGLSEIIRTLSTNSREIVKFYGRNFSSVANNLIVLKEIIESTPERKDLSSMSLNDLLGLRDSLSSQENGCETPELFYTNLWKSVGNLILLICSQEFEDSIENNPDIFKTLSHHILSLQKALRQNGIKIVAYPTEETENLFKPTATDEIPSKPLIYRAKDNYVYTYGLLNDLKPYTLND